MEEGYSYSKIIEAKDGNKIPLCAENSSGQEITLHSKYNPVREAEGFAASTDESILFFVVFGLAGGYHIEKLAERCPKSKILVIEKNQKSIDFLMEIPTVEKISKNRRIHISTIENIQDSLFSLYKPAIHGNLTILSLRQWENIFKNEASLCREKITESIKILASDYSVQSHFGKIWQKNIIINLSMAEKCLDFAAVKQSLAKARGKTAAIIAAGPSLDENIKRLKENRHDYFIIATDTAFSSLVKQNLECDAVISIDGQMISHQHYMEKFMKAQKTLFVFDLCASPAAARKVLSKTKNVLFAETGHPLAQYASLFTGKRTFVHLEAGSGTVTIAGVSLAKELGFGKIELFGADFSYIKGRPYCRGTYLEGQFNAKSTRFYPSEQAYTALMYRTPVIRLSDDKITTEILEAYKTSLSDFMKKKNGKSPYGDCNGKFCLSKFKSRYSKDLTSAFKSEDEIDENSLAFTTLLPLCAKMGKGSAFLAYLKTLRYTERV